MHEIIYFFEKPKKVSTEIVNNDRTEKNKRKILITKN